MSSNRCVCCSARNFRMVQCKLQPRDYPPELPSNTLHLRWTVPNFNCSSYNNVYTSNSYYHSWKSRRAWVPPNRDLRGSCRNEGMVHNQLQPQPSILSTITLYLQLTGKQMLLDRFDYTLTGLSLITIVALKANNGR